MLRQQLPTTVNSNFITVNGSQMHYLEHGAGKPILFIHGMPSSSYLWRNVMPHLQQLGRCIAIDLMGHGKSDSPNIEFSVEEHLDYLTKFINQLGLQDILIVGHSWGATLGIAYAKAHPNNVRALSYLEPMLGAPQELPIAGSPSNVVDLVNDNFKWQKQTAIPQLFFYTSSAAFFTTEKAKAFSQSAVNVSLYYLGNGGYNHAEDYPHDIGIIMAGWLKNNYKLEKAMPKFSLYTAIHKAIRKEMFETCLMAGSIDYYNNKASDNFMEKFNALLALLRSHSIHEDTFIHPLLEKMPDVFAFVNNDHQELEEELSQLEQLLDSVLAIENKTDCLEAGNNFYLALSQFTSKYLAHLLFEEQTIMPALHENYDLSFLMAVMDRFKTSQSPEEAMHSLDLILRAINC